MRDAVICAAVRTPVGSRGAGLSGVHAADLVAGGVESMSRVPMGSSVGDGSTGRPLGPDFLARTTASLPTRAWARR